MRRNGPEDFWAHVQFTESCWDWTGYFIPHGYGRIRWQGRKTLAHRVAYEMCVGPIPACRELDHLCRNRRCVRPDHLEPVTHSTNVLRGAAPAQVRERAKAITHCPHGHEYTTTNTKHTIYGKYITRSCRECRRIDARRRKAAQRAQRAATAATFS